MPPEAGIACEPSPDLRLRERKDPPGAPLRWEDAPGGMQRIRVGRGWIYRFIWTRDGNTDQDQTLALGLTYVPDPEAT